VDQTLFMSYIY